LDVIHRLKAFMDRSKVARTNTINQIRIRNAFRK
jgi:hypothetical protein